MNPKMSLRYMQVPLAIAGVKVHAFTMRKILYQFNLHQSFGKKKAFAVQKEH